MDKSGVEKIQKMQQTMQQLLIDYFSKKKERQCRFADRIKTSPGNLNNWIYGRKGVPWYHVENIKQALENINFWVDNLGEKESTRKKLTKKDLSSVSRQYVWQLKHQKETRTQSLSNHFKDHLTIIYECPHNGLKHNHHFDYSRPLEVIRLCNQCHVQEHVRLRRIANTSPLPDNTDTCAASHIVSTADGVPAEGGADSSHGISLSDM